jgi:hypothetical protein
MHKTAVQKQHIHMLAFVLAAAHGAALHTAAQQVDEGAAQLAAAWPAAALIVWVAQSMLQLAL